MIALIGAAGIAGLLVLTLLRLHAGPTLYDRALAASSVTAKAALICAALAAAAGRADFVDPAFALALGGFVLNLAILKFFRTGTLQAPMVREG
ncbi:MAG TPA: monovalent cation/H+ antiporter complex subunit F [Candidatus Binatia bacterium]|nr:monovalent cation/H+ antiporter complex subunit F [Candidatus Binatia bacterium]